MSTHVASATGRSGAVTDGAPIGAVRLWLLVVAFMVFLMVVVGGITRLTESGLSIVHWEPISGVIPPLNEAEWQAELEHYRQTPEYQKVNRGMSLDAFKQIYFWEYLHRLLGRLVGLVYALPFFWFLWKRAIPAPLKPRLWAFLALGGLQGVIGWWMVASGLVERTDVSHYRLAVHLSLALVIFAGLFWTWLELKPQPVPLPGDRTTHRWTTGLLVLLSVQIVFGAFVAGLDAGYAFNTWPKMGEHWIADGAWLPALGLANLTENLITVQFVHRTGAFVVVGATLITAFHAWRRGMAGPAVALVAAVALQFLLGIATLVMGVPISIGTAHQGGAVVVLAAVLWLLYRSRAGTA